MDWINGIYKILVDTNVLVSSRDAYEPPKQAQAMDRLRHLWNTHAGRLSYQVLQEFYFTVTEKRSIHMSM